ncbi:MAG: hypothetical protein APR63_07210 [Desulfuromonas sp. SDB]|nr:MAG: hypothetical protein APR63_07210 [Desulfuromonas sp. SDB]
MSNIFLLLIMLFSYPAENEMLVRVYASDYQQLNQIQLKSLDIAGREYQQYFDLVITPDQFSNIISSGLDYEVITDNLTAYQEQFRGSYHSYTETNNILRNYATTYSNICVLDSIGQSYQGRWIYCLKISDNPGYEDPSEPGVLFDGLHHSREWATIEVILFYADTLLTGYGSDPDITNLVNNNEIWLIPIMNPDGYEYDYPGQNMWRKNRKPFGGSTGTDLNRNYNGALNGDPDGDWGVVPPNASMSNNPSSTTFCGAYAGWGDAVYWMMEFYRNHDINANITYHSYAEEIIWPWAYNTSIKTPDSTAYEFIANQLSSRIQRLNGGNYVASGSLYPNTGTTRTWVYGYHHFICGTSCLAYTIEVGTSFYQPTGDLDDIVRENWDGAMYLAQMADSIRDNLLARVPSPQVDIPDSATTASCPISWIPVNSAWNSPDKWQLDHLQGYSYTTDDIESGTSNWILNGFTQSTVREHSGSYSLFSGSADNISNVAQTKYPYLVQPGDSLIFWCWYDLENNYDVATVEISVDQMEWIQFDVRYTNNSGGWIQKKYSLEDYQGQAVYFRFRSMTDDNTLDEGFYVDDIYPVPEFSSITVVDSNITDTTYNLTSLPVGDHYFRVRGHNSRGWGNYSNTEKTVICSAGNVHEQPVISEPFTFSAIARENNITVNYQLPQNDNVSIQLFDLSGRMVQQYSFENQVGNHNLTIPVGRSGIWFVRFSSKHYSQTEKLMTVQ